VTLRLRKCNRAGYPYESAIWDVVGAPLRIFKDHTFHLVDGDPVYYSRWTVGVPLLDATPAHWEWHYWLHGALERDGYPRFRTRRDLLDWLEAELAIDPPCLD
jgi:hypothetical protein